MAISSLDIVVGAQNRTQAGLNASFASVRAWGERVSGVMQGVAQGIGQQITSTVMRAFDGVRRALEGGFRTAAGLEQTEVALRTLLGTADKAKAMMGELTAFAAATPFEFPELADAAKMLVAFGVNAEDVTPTLRTLGDVASGVGMSIQELTEAYGRNLVQGRLTAQDINQLTGRGIPIIRELAKQFNVAESEVRNLVSSGQVQSVHMVRAFRAMAASGGQFAGMMEQQSKTISGLMSTLRDEVSMTMADIANRIMEAIDARALIERLTTIVKMIGTEGFFGVLLDDMKDNAKGVAETVKANFLESMVYVETYLKEAGVRMADWALSQGNALFTALMRAWVSFRVSMKDFIDTAGEQMEAENIRGNLMRLEEAKRQITDKLRAQGETQEAIDFAMNATINPQIEEAVQKLKYIADMQQKRRAEAVNEEMARIGAIDAAGNRTEQRIAAAHKAELEAIKKERNERLAGIEATREAQLGALRETAESRWAKLLNKIMGRDNEAAKPVAELSDPTAASDRKNRTVRDMTPPQIEGLLLTGLQQAAKERYALMGNAMVNEQKTTNVTLNKIHDVLKTNKELKELVKVLDRLSLGAQTLFTR